MTFLTKLKYWWKFTVSCIKTPDNYLNFADGVDKLTTETLKLAFESEDGKEVLLNPDLCQLLFGVYLITQNYYQTILSGSLSGFGINYFNMLRTQLEAAFILFYFIEDKDFEKTDVRVEEYQEWLFARMYKNSIKSREYHILQHFSSHDSFINQVEENFRLLQEKYPGDEGAKKVKELTNRSSFLRDKTAIAKKLNIENLYHHIFIESSATIHVADISDRVNVESNGNSLRYSFHNQTQDAFWVLNLSIQIQLSVIKHFSIYFSVFEDIEPSINSLLDRIEKEIL